MKKVNHKRRITVSFITLALILAIVQVIFSTNFTTEGINLSQLQYQTQQVEKENMILGERLYTQTAYTTIAAEAKTEGFAQDAKATVVINTPSDVALNQ